MSNNIQFFKKNKIDLDVTQVVITATDDVATDNGQASADLLRNRNNTSGWMTTDSDDTATTTLEANMVNQNDIDNIILVNHNFKEFTIQYWNGLSYVNFSPTINQTTNAETTSRFSFTKVTTSKIKITITATQTANADKRMTQLIITELLGTFNMQPEIKPEIDKNRKVTKYLSGKKNIARSLESFTVDFAMKNVINSADLSLVETLYDSYFGFLVWLCGGTQDQYLFQRRGYRLEDIFLMNVANEYSPQYEESRYSNGIKVDLRLVEVV